MATLPWVAASAVVSRLKCRSLTIRLPPVAFSASNPATAFWISSTSWSRIGASART